MARTQIIMRACLLIVLKVVQTHRYVTVKWGPNNPYQNPKWPNKRLTWINKRWTIASKCGRKTLRASSHLPRSRCLPSMKLFVSLASKRIALTISHHFIANPLITTAFRPESQPNLRWPALTQAMHKAQGLMWRDALVKPTQSINKPCSKALASQCWTLRKRMKNFWMSLITRSRT